MEAINLKQIPTEYIMRTKGGNLWRCGKGYRKDWSKLIGKEVLLHNKPYTLTQRVKKNSKWYLVYTDGTNSYTELQTKAINNKNMAKDTIIEVAKRVIAGLLTAPKELIDQLVEQVERLVQQYNEPFISNPANYTSKGKLKTSIRNMLLDNYQQFIQEPQYNTQFANKVDFIANALDIIGNITITKKIGRILKRNYHPDSNIGSTEKFMLINKLIRY